MKNWIKFDPTNKDTWPKYDIIQKDSIDIWVDIDSEVYLVGYAFRFAHGPCFFRGTNEITNFITHWKYLEFPQPPKPADQA